MGLKQNMLVGDVEVPYEHPNRTQQEIFPIEIFSIDFYALSDETCCQKQITGNIVKIAIFNMAAMKKVLTITDKQNLPINVIVENYNEISS